MDQQQTQTQDVTLAWEALPGARAILDEQGSVLNANRAWTQWWEEHPLRHGRKSESFLEFCSLASGAGAAGLNKLSAGIREALDAKQPNFDLEYSEPVGSETHWWLARVARLENSSGIRVMVELLDTTAYKVDAQQNFQERKMTALSKLAGGLAHDFNNLLMVIKGYGELLQRNAERPETVRRNADQILKATTRATDLTSQLLQFGRHEPVPFPTINLADVVRDSENLLGRMLGSGIQIQGKRPTAPVYINADAGRLSQAILNLALNARDAMQNGGILRLETSRIDLDETAARRVGLASGKAAMLLVADQGFGMDEGIKTRLFEPFFTTKPKGKGMGLGLSMVYGMIKQAAGAITVESEPGKGTTFRLYFPRQDDSAPVLKSDSEFGLPSMREAAGTILLVEDELEVRELVKEILEARGYTILMADSGFAAIEFAANPGLSIDLLFTDLELPGMKGQELAQRIHTLRPALKTLFTSGFNEQSVVHSGLLSAGMEFIQKPYAGADLLKRITRLLGK